eukprot:GHVT01039488.1.p1 GENE.GHVT01039488.1~~GHVT01039488.1.p1  ORF type:complete len:705 (-),score=131.58 GHVT01039488.1:1079-3193(-)
MWPAIPGWLAGGSRHRRRAGAAADEASIALEIGDLAARVETSSSSRSDDIRAPFSWTSSVLPTPSSARSSLAVPSSASSPPPSSPPPTLPRTAGDLHPLLSPVSAPSPFRIDSRDMAAGGNSRRSIRRIAVAGAAPPSVGASASGRGGVGLDLAEGDASAGGVDSARTHAADGGGAFSSAVLNSSRSEHTSGSQSGTGGESSDVSSAMNSDRREARASTGSEDGREALGECRVSIARSSNGAGPPRNFQGIAAALADGSPSTPAGDPIGVAVASRPHMQNGETAEARPSEESSVMASPNRAAGSSLSSRIGSSFISSVSSPRGSSSPSDSSSPTSSSGSSRLTSSSETASASSSPSESSSSSGASESTLSSNGDFTTGPVDDGSQFSSAQSWFSRQFTGVDDQEEAARLRQARPRKGGQLGTDLMRDVPMLPGIPIYSPGQGDTGRRVSSLLLLTILLVVSLVSWKHRHVLDISVDLPSADVHAALHLRNCNLRISASRTGSNYVTVRAWKNRLDGFAQNARGGVRQQVASWPAPFHLSIDLDVRELSSWLVCSVHFFLVPEYKFASFVVQFGPAAAYASLSAAVPLRASVISVDALHAFLTFKSVEAGKISFTLGDGELEFSLDGKSHAYDSTPIFIDSRTAPVSVTSSLPPRIFSPRLPQKKQRTRSGFDFGFVCCTFCEWNGGLFFLFICFSRAVDGVVES